MVDSQTAHPLERVRRHGTDILALDASVCELHIQENRVSVAWHQVWYHETPCAGQSASVQSAARNVVEGSSLGDRQPELIVIEEQVLAIKRDAKVFIVLIADARDEALEIQWILGDIVVWQEPLEQPKDCELCSGYMITAENIPPNLTTAAVVKHSLVHSSLRTKAGERIVARGAGAAGVSSR